MPETTRSKNVSQEEFWNGPMAEKWRRYWPHVDRLLLPFTDRLLRSAAAQEGEVTLDVGCGPGTTTLALGHDVGVEGRAVGIDISRVLLEVAECRRDEAGLSQVSFFRGDAAKADTPSKPVDLILSRFGIMFFDEPEAAFAHLRSVMKPGGRIRFVCWLGLEDNPWMRAGIEVASNHATPSDPPGPGTPGAFAFSDPDRVRQILREAGLTRVEVDRLDASVAVGPTAEEAAEFFIEMGPGAKLFEDLSADKLDQARRELVAMYRSHASRGGVHMEGAAWLVQAMNQ
ncbi:MAG: class I SAM-dependent methyltransferase [Myxococcota bacterium]